MSIYDIAGATGDGQDGGKKGSATPATPDTPNYTLTKDPNVVIGKYGVPITKDQFIHANKNGYGWTDFDSYANYVGGWAKPIDNPIPISPYYRTYGGTPNINGVDVAILAAKNDPNINKLIQSNIAPAGQTPMYGAETADTIRKLIANEKTQSGYTAPTQPMPDGNSAAAVAAVTK